MIRTIIPCAGFGTRMFMVKNKSKELLINPETKKPLIDFHLERAINPLIITRAEKVDLIEYAENRGIEVLIIEPHGEWYDTILASEELWGDQNILVLPDTIYERSNIIDTFETVSKYNLDITVAYHWVNDISKWGAFNLKSGKMCEKPKADGTGHAWGILMFSKEYGPELFKQFKDRRWFKLPKHNSLCLSSFQDLTRKAGLVR